MKWTNYSKEELVRKINKLDIYNVGNSIITKYDGRIISTSDVSDRYEIFDIKSYLLSKIEQIEQNFTIHKYSFTIKGGVQRLILLSDEIDLEQFKFHKSFFIINSSNRSRKLSFNLGLYSKLDNLFFINGESISFSKKHLKGVTKAAEESTSKLNDETFTEQIEMIKKLLNHSVKLSNLQKAIIGEDPTVKINHTKFDALKSNLIYLSGRGKLRLNNSQISILKKQSSDLSNHNFEDFYLDAFVCFIAYLQLFATQDSHIIKKESERILNITQSAIRNSIIEKILMD
jgi:hypothetical protein